MVFRLDHQAKTVNNICSIEPLIFFLIQAHPVVLVIRVNEELVVRYWMN